MRRHTLRRRSQKDRITWAQMTQLVNAWLPKPIILHPCPSVRLAVTHPRWSRVRESRTYGSVRGARDEIRVPTATWAARLRHAARRRGSVAARGARAAARDVTVCFGRVG